MQYKKGVVLFIIFALIFTINVKASPEDEHARVSRILKNCVDALGGDKALKSVRSIITSAEVEIEGTGFKGTIKSYFSKPCLMYTELSLMMFKLKTGFDGENAWVVDNNGKVLINRDPDISKNYILNCMFNSYKLLYSPDKFTTHLEKPDTVDGDICDVINYTIEGVGDYTIYIDRNTHLIRKTMTSAGVNTVETTYRDYKPVNGIMMAFQTESFVVQLLKKMKMRYTSIEINKPIDPAIFFPPSKDIVDYRFTNKAGLSTVKMKMHNGHIFIPVMLKTKPQESDTSIAKTLNTPEWQNKPILFMLDSGASKSFIDSTLAIKLGFELGEGIPGAGAGGTAYFYTVKVPGFRVGDIEFEEQTIFSFPISNMAKRFTGLTLGGMLGYDFLSRFIAEINFEDSTITFYQPDTFNVLQERAKSFETDLSETPEESCTIDAPLLNNIFSFRATVNDSISGRFLLDTGANASMLFKSFISRHKLNPTSPIEISIFGAGGEQKTILSRINSIGFCDFTIEEPIFSFSQEKVGIGAFDKIDGIIGNNILSRFNVILNYRDQKVILTKNNLFSRPFFTDKAGIVPEVTEDGSIRVYYTIKNTPADRVGIRRGDIIIKANGHRLSGNEGFKKLGKLLSGRNGKTITFVIKRKGKVIRLRLRLKKYI